MPELVVLFVHLIVAVIRLARSGRLRSVVAESALIRHQLLIPNRGCQPAPTLRAEDPIIAGLCPLSIRPDRLLRSAIVLWPSTLLNYHRALWQWMWSIYSILLKRMGKELGFKW